MLIANISPFPAFRYLSLKCGREIRQITDEFRNSDNMIVAILELLSIWIITFIGVTC